MQRIVADDVFQAFVREAVKLNSMKTIDAVDLDFSSRHLCSVLKIRPAKVLFAENIQYDGNHESQVVGLFSVKDMGIRNLIKIDKSRKKAEMINTFIHELYHRWQYADLAAFQRAVQAGTFEKDAYAFASAVCREAGVPVND
jgi:hypothetical protein